MLWTRRHRPTEVEDLPQPEAREALEPVVDAGVNVVIYGPSGAGKTAAARLFEPDFEVNARDLFGMTKDEIAEDRRFRAFVTAKRKRSSSKADLVNHVLKEVASHDVGEGRKLVLIDDADGMRRDLQQALRRVMETVGARFVLTARSMSSLIPAISSRCYPVSMRAPSDEEVVGVLRGIARDEGVEYEDSGLEYVASAAESDLRQAVLLLQAVASRGPVTSDSAFDVVRETARSPAEDVLGAASSEGFAAAVDEVDDLLIERGWEGREVVDALLDVSNRVDGPAEYVRMLGDVDVCLSDAANDRVHLERLLAEISRGS